MRRIASGLSQVLALVGALLVPDLALADCGASHPQGALRAATQPEVEKAFYGKAIAPITVVGEEGDTQSVIVSSAGSSTFAPDGTFLRGRDRTGPYADGRWSAGAGRLELSGGRGWSVYVDEAGQVFWTEDGGWPKPWPVPFMCPVY